MKEYFCICNYFILFTQLDCKGSLGLVRIEIVVQSIHVISHQVVQNKAVLVDVFGARLAHLRLPLALPVLHRQRQHVLVIVLSHVRARLPRLLVRAVLLHSHRENVLLPVSRVQRQDAHQHKVRAHADDQYGLGLGERVLKVPTERNQSDDHGQGADQESSVDQSEILSAMGSLHQGQLDRVIDGVLHGCTVPLVNFDQLEGARQDRKHSKS